MRPLSEIEAEITAINRPTLANFVDAINPAKRAAIAQVQAGWDSFNPEKARRWHELRAEHRATEAVEDARNIAKAEAARLLSNLSRIVGDKALEAIPAAIRDPHDGMRAAQRFEGSEDWSLTLVGGVGTGKTVPAAWLAKKTLEAGETLVWWRAPNVATASVYGPEAGERNKRACAAKLLVLDDLGAELTTGPWVAMLEDVLGYRYAHKAKTVVTGNLLLESPNKADVTLRSMLRDRLFDRLTEGIVIGTGKGSMRRRSA
jgi:hypothetical protein